VQKENSKNKDKTTAIKGVPEALDLVAARKYALSRVGKKRGDHVVGVEKVGRQIARALGYAPEKQMIVELACVLHDACKETKDRDLVAQATEYGLAPDAIEQANGHLLHGPVAAKVVEAELGIKNHEILDAITEHTLGKNPMTDISKIVFLADCLEESRPKSYTQPIWDALTNSQEKDPGKNLLETGVNLDKAMLVALELGLAHLLESGRVIHPKTVDVRNYFLGIVKASEMSQ
jgi:predicted HD superfamily hydrolase involved in NAD metabolism